QTISSRWAFTIPTLPMPRLLDLQTRRRTPFPPTPDSIVDVAMLPVCYFLAARRNPCNTNLTGSISAPLAKNGEARHPAIWDLLQNSTERRTQTKSLPLVMSVPVGINTPLPSRRTRSQSPSTSFATVCEIPLERPMNSVSVQVSQVSMPRWSFRLLQ